MSTRNCHPLRMPSFGGLACILLGLLFWACRAGEEAPTPSVVTPSPVPATSTALSGKLYFSTETDYVELDPVSGLITRLFRCGIGTRPSLDGREFTVIRSRTRARAANDDQFHILRRDGTILVHFEKEEFLDGPAKLSPNRQLVVMDWESPRRGDRPGQPTATVFRRNGSIAARFPGAHSYDWTPDNRLLLVNEDTFFLTTTALTEPAPVVSLPNPLSRDRPRHVEISPDGRQVAFVRGLQGEDDAHIFLMNLDGSGLRQLTTSRAGEDNPSWSPNGQFLTFRHGASLRQRGSKHGASDCPLLFAVRIDASVAEVGASTDGAAFPVRFLEDGELHPTCAYSSPAWRTGSTSGIRSDGLVTDPDPPSP